MALAPLLSLALALAIPRAAVALDPLLRVSQYHKQYWGVQEGLPHSYVTAVAHAPEGFLLVGTDEGLARFDGLEFRPAALDAGLRLNRKWISAMLATGDGRLWLGTFEGEIFRFRDGLLQQRYEVGGSIFALHSGPDDSLWASTRNGVYRILNGTLERLSGLAPPLETSWNVLSQLRADTLLIVTADGLFEHRMGTTRQIVQNGGPWGEVLSVLGGRSGRIWLGTSTGLFMLAKDATREPVRMPGVEGPVVSLLEDRDGVLWAGSWGRGLFRIFDEAVHGWASTDGLPDNFIRTLAEDREGNLWIGTRSGGLGRWKSARLVPLGQPEGLAGDYASTVAADRGGNLWLGSWRGGLYRLVDAEPIAQPTPVPTLYSTIRAIAFDRSDLQWIGNWEGLFEFDGNRYRHHASSPDSPYRRVSALLFDARGGLWVGTVDKGLFHFPDGRPNDSEESKPVLTGAITSLLEDSRGRLWVGTPRGLVRTAGNGVVPSQQAFITTSDPVESIFEDGAKRIWATTAGGTIAVVTQEGAKVLGPQHGLPAHPLYRVLEDPEGVYWISSPRGLIALERGAVDDVLAGKRDRLEMIRFGQEDGMRTLECHGLSQPSGWRDRQGILWFPTARGFVQVRPLRPGFAAPPATKVMEVFTGQGSLSGQVSRDGIVLQAGDRNLQLGFTALRLSYPQRLQFRYRIQGFDPDWVDASSQRIARYNQLPPGDHLFEVQSRDPFAGWGESASIRIRQLPYFYQTWWFRVLLALAAAAAIWAIYRWRVLSLQSRYALVLGERNRIGSEWHDTLVAGFSAISLQLEAATARLREQPERALEILDVTRKMVQHYRAEARRVIWDLRDTRPEDERLHEALEAAHTRVCQNRAIQGGVTTIGDELPLSVEAQHNVLRICQEAMSNAARHGAPSRIDVDLQYGSQFLVARVRDDGRGFDPLSAALDSTGHFGLAVMQERARKLGGTLVVDSRSGEGTRVEVTIPFPRENRR
jgi:signal transduction histidine kinase/ligand-binding sensor domain-containing protein